MNRTGAGLALFIIRGGSRGERIGGGVFFCSMSIVRPQLWEGGQPQDGGRQVQDEVSVTGPAVAPENEQVPICLEMEGHL